MKPFRSSSWNFLVLLAIWATLASGCNREQQIQSAVDLERVVATVNGEKISMDSLSRAFYLAKRKFRVGKNDPISEDEKLWLKSNTLNEIIRKMLLLQQAREHNIEINENEFNAYRVQLRQGYQPDSFQRTLEALEISQEEWDEQIRTRLLIKKLIDELVNSKVNLSEDVLKNYFEAHREEFQKGERVRTLHILVTAEEEARQILKWIEKGQDFSDLAREHSQSLEGAEGGDMGYFEAGHLPEEFDPIFKLNPGEVSDIIQTPYGFHVFKVVDKKPARQRVFEEAREEIHASLLEEAREKAFQKWLEGVHAKAKIEIHNEVLDQIS